LVLGGDDMSSDLKDTLDKVVEEDCAQKELEIERGIERFKFLLFKIAEAKKWDLAVWVMGEDVQDVAKYEIDLNLLERGNLIKGKMKFSEHNAYREYTLTKKGSDLVKKLKKESS
jgi:hypothetical protein